MRTSKALILIPAALALVAMVFLSHSSIVGNAVAGDDAKQIKRLRSAMLGIHRYYPKDITDKQMIEGAINGMLQSLDPHSSFLSEDLFRELQVETKGEFGGLGIEITLEAGALTIVSPIEDTPAFKAGLKAGDRIVKINGESTKKITLLQAVKKMRGPKGTSVTLTVMRDGFSKAKDYEIIRDIIHVKSVKKQLIEPGYPYVRIVNFQESTTKDLKQAINGFGGDDKIRGLILDLRNNPGGLLDQAVKVSNLFVEKGLIVYTDGRVKNQRMEFKAIPGGEHFKFKLAILINEGSASASEIVAGAMQDHNRALIFGIKSFGKASVQTIIELENGSGLRLTTAYYYTPKGRHIQKTGIIPDVNLKPEVEQERDKRIEEESKAGKKEDIRKRFGKTKIDPNEDIVVKKALEWLKSDVSVEQYKLQEKGVIAEKADAK